MTDHVIREALRETYGLEPEVFLPDVWKTAVAERQAIHRTDEQGYVRLVSENHEERAALAQALLVPESWFFRDRQPFLWLLREAPRLARTPAGRPLRLLSLPCARGEEAYSLAITLRRAGLAPGDWTIDAVDLSAEFIAAARRGNYSPGSVRGEPPFAVDEYLLRQGDGRWQTDADLGHGIHFQVGNMLDPIFWRDRAPYDIIFCRNLMIYLSNPAKLKALGFLKAALKPDGYFIIGHADSTAELHRLFGSVREPGTFCHRHREALPSPSPSRPKPPAVARRSSPRPKKPVPGPQAETVPLPVEATSGDWLARVKALADAGLLSEAKELCDAGCARQPDNAEAWHWAGLIHLALGAIEQADHAFRKALYLEPRRADTLHQRMLLAENRGDGALVIRLRRQWEALTTSG